MSDDDVKKYEGGEVHEGPERTSPYPVHRESPAIELVDLAKEIAHADNMISSRASAKLEVIANQIKALQSEARTVLEKTQQDQELHRAQCQFKRIPGKIYHLYRRSDGTLYFSMLSPLDWRDNPPHTFVASYRLENDMSWTPAERMDEPDETQKLVKRLLGESPEEQSED